MHFLYDSFISPLELLLEFFFKLVQVITKNPALAVISLSFIVTILTLPLYMIAEKWQETERLMQSIIVNISASGNKSISKKIYLLENDKNHEIHNS